MSSNRDSLFSVWIQSDGDTLGRMGRGYLLRCVTLATKVDTHIQIKILSSPLFHPRKDYPFRDSLRSVWIWALRKEATQGDCGLDLQCVVPSWHGRFDESWAVRSMARCTKR